MTAPPGSTRWPVVRCPRWPPTVGPPACACEPALELPDEEPAELPGEPWEPVELAGGGVPDGVDAGGGVVAWPTLTPGDEGPPGGGGPAVTETICDGGMPGTVIALAGVPGGTSTVTVTWVPPISVTVSVRSSAEAEREPAARATTVRPAAPSASSGLRALIMRVTT